MKRRNLISIKSRIEMSIPHEGQICLDEVLLCTYHSNFVEKDQGSSLKEEECRLDSRLEVLLQVSNFSIDNFVFLT